MISSAGFAEFQRDVSNAAMRTILAVLLLIPIAAQAAPGRRFAMIVGANRGDAADQPLRFAEADAKRMARTLRELGGFAAADIVELNTPSAADVARGLASLSERILVEAKSGRPSLLLFYYSGHSDEEALHLAGEHISLDSLRSWLRTSPAAVRLAVLDSCRSGALTRVKGAHAAPPIEVRLTDELAMHGEAMLTSSTSDEMARESDALRGSFFTHHLVSGLRGAADSSRDGRVTLAEAYDYAYSHTVSEANGGQHPMFKFDFGGRGDIVLTSLSDAGAWLGFGEGASGRYLIFDQSGQLLGEVDVRNLPIKVALTPGAYEVMKVAGNSVATMPVRIGVGEERWIHDEELHPQPASFAGANKGDVREQPTAAIASTVEPPKKAPPKRRRWPIWVGVGAGALATVGLGLGIGLGASHPAMPSGR